MSCCRPWDVFRGEETARGRERADERRAGRDYRRRRRGRLRRACSSGIRPPRRSSAIRSSQPPTWVSPMKICGTVRRPVSSHHRCALRRDRRSTRISSICVHAALLEQRLGADAVRADLRWCTSSHAFGPAIVARNDAHVASAPTLPRGLRDSRRGRLLDRQVGVAPGLQAAGEGAARSRSPSLRNIARGARGARAGGAHHHQRQRLVLGSSSAPCSVANGTLRAPAAWPRANSSGSLTSISTRLLAVDQLHRLDVPTAAAAARRCRVGHSSRPPEVERRQDQTPSSRCKKSSGSLSRLRVRTRMAGVTQGANYRIRAPVRLSTPHPDAQARADPPRRIDLEPGEPLHRLDRRRPHRHRRRAGQRGRPPAEGGRLRLRPRLHLGAQARHLDPVARARRDGPHLAAGGATTGASTSATTARCRA